MYIYVIVKTTLGFHVTPFVIFFPFLFHLKELKHRTKPTHIQYQTKSSIQLCMSPSFKTTMGRMGQRLKDRIFLALRRDQLFTKEQQHLCLPTVAEKKISCKY